MTEPRFRQHHKRVGPDKIIDKIRLEELLPLITMNDVIHRRYLDESHHSYIPDFGVFILDYDENGQEKYHLLSRQMVIFSVERRKAWRMLQSRAGIENKDYQVQKTLLKEIKEGTLTRASHLTPHGAEQN